MLGNWSFGDYFKKEAIEWAWELLTEVYKLDKDRLYATVFEGYADDNLEMDSEAKNLWLKYLPEDHIILGNKKDNFWEMGDTGPCGPCSEIHIDLRDDKERAEISGAEMVNKGHHLVIEIWNLVFMQFNRKANGSLEPLPQKHVDTGMGFERLCMALQNKKSNYDTDVFTGMITKISELCGKPYTPDNEVGIAIRVIADHIRAISFSIADGQLPSNVKAGYVIRRILRRAVRYGYTFLDLKEPFLCKLVAKLVEEMGESYPEIAKQQKLIEDVVKNEEEAFLRTLDKGIILMNQIMKKSEESKVISGSDAFTLYDTFGFPIDLSELIARENGYSIDFKGFEEELNKQKERARSATAKEAGDWVVIEELPQEDFVGYDSLAEDIKIAKYRTVKSKGKEAYQIVFDKTPFYAESGGQIGDTGHIITEKGEKIMILGTIKENNLSIHIADRLPLDTESSYKAYVDVERRREIARNHTATHLLHHALREVLGSHIEQKGSYVSNAYFRFDFSHFEKISPENLKKVEKLVNKLIRENFVREEHRSMAIEEAKALGATALFGEKYGDYVRVIKFGDSIELCGGTHTGATGDIGLLKIVSESAIAAGVRRIEAVTGSYAENLVDTAEDTLNTIKSCFNNTPNVIASIQKMIQENEAAKKALEEAARKHTIELKEKIISNKTTINGLDIYTFRGVSDGETMKNIAFMLYKEVEVGSFIAAYTTPDGKACLTLMYTDSLIKNGFNASKDIREASKFIQGGGGGQNYLATAGGKNPDGLSEAMELLIKMATK